MTDRRKLILASLAAQKQLDAETSPELAPRRSRSSTFVEVAHQKISASNSNRKRFSLQRFLSGSGRKTAKPFRGKGANIDVQREDHGKPPLQVAVQNRTDALRKISAEYISERHATATMGVPGITSGPSLIPDQMARSSQDVPIEIQDPAEDSSSRVMTAQERKPILDIPQSSLNISQPGFSSKVGEDDDQWAKNIRLQFEELLRAKRKTYLRRSRYRTESPLAPDPAASASDSVDVEQLPSYPASTLDGTPSGVSQSNATSLYLPLPKIPSPPVDSQSQKFRNLLITLSLTPTRYENSGLLDEALQVIPLGQIYNEAEEECKVLQARAESTGRQPKWGYQDCVIRALLRYATFYIIRNLILISN
jgi:hypothetical protein